MDRPSMTETTGCIRYPCPRCRVELETRADDGWSGWRRCPACDRPHLPPDPADHAPPPWESAGTRREEIHRNGADEDVLIIGPSDEDHQPASLWNPRQFEPFGRAHQSRQSRWHRRWLTVGLGLSLFALLFAFLEQGEIAVGAFALISLVLFLLLARPARKAI
jgi:hypothetical protein